MGSHLDLPVRRPVVGDVINRVLRTREFLIENADETWAALRAYGGSSADFADCLLARTNFARGCDTTATFD